MEELTESTQKTTAQGIGLPGKSPFSKWEHFARPTPEDDDPLCWRCAQPDSQHSWYGGITYCESAFTEDEGEKKIDLSRTFQAFPSEISDEELIKRMEFVRDVRDWML